MATNLSTCHPGDGIEALNRLPGLAEPLLQIDLDRELQQLRREESWQRATGPSSKTLAKYPDFRIVLILMKGGTRMRQHRAEGRVSIQQLKGAGPHTFGRPESERRGWPFVGAGLRRSARRRSAGRECVAVDHLHLDEEALSRMVDEGGAPDAAVNPPGAAGKAGPVS